MFLGGRESRVRERRKAAGAGPVFYFVSVFRGSPMIHAIGAPSVDAAIGDRAAAPELKRCVAGGACVWFQDKR